MMLCYAAARKCQRQSFLGTDGLGAVPIVGGPSAWEAAPSRVVADALFDALPTNDSDRQSLLETGHAVAEIMSWERVVGGQLLAALKRATR